MESLINKKCLPCEGIGRALTQGEVQSHLGEIPGWAIGSDGKSIERSLTLKNFVACVNFINKIKDIAEDQQHHPDVHLTGYKHLKVVLYTHALGGITENDLILAAKINQLEAHV
ncbi:MAG: 4a-hydroxytetrahydrobiopterin dehydratase [Candidatus Omnitrophica bacterium]|nr:4a-hydroxytetrahydrobiopterin dehydratase [Candidatus Omnitrophota bacterium]MDE2221947.1 4a-hydroxytetrahydrobiopterin dehydratase [Candidatus Omnitrophota bacterium]